MKFCSVEQDFSLGLAEWIFEKRVVEDYYVGGVTDVKTVTLADVTDWADSAGFSDWLSTTTAMRRGIYFTEKSRKRLTRPDIVDKWVAAAPKYLKELQDFANARFVVVGADDVTDEWTSVTWATFRGNPRELRHALSMGGSPDSTVALGKTSRSHTAVSVALHRDGDARTLVGRAACLTLLIEAGAKLFEDGYGGGVVDIESKLDMRAKDAAMRVYRKWAAETTAKTCMSANRCASITCARRLGPKHRAAWLGDGRYDGGRCNGCMVAKYCSYACASKNWWFHKDWCKSTDAHACYTFLHM